MIKVDFSSADPIANLKEVQDRIRKEPARADLRIFLFQLYCLMGEWGKAGNQLDTLSELDPQTSSMVRTYRETLRCEGVRREVFSGIKTPLILGDPEDWLAGLFEALSLNAAGHHAQARTLRERSLAAAPATPGSIDGQPFTWFADADTRLGPVLEAIVNGKYYWIPVQRLSRVVLDAPADLRDMVWMPATLTFADGGENAALIPSRYPGTEACPDHRLQLARRTEWRDLGAETYAGLGQRMFATDQAEYALLDIREVLLGSTHG